MRPRLRCLSILTALAAATCSLRAEIPLSVYQDAQKRGGQEAMATVGQYITGFGTGLMWANVVMAMTGRTEARMFCVPPKLRVGEEIYLSILNDQIKAVKYKPTMAIEQILFDGLVATFPCEKQ